jgi:uncharacterized protein YrrD
MRVDWMGLLQQGIFSERRGKVIEISARRHLFSDVEKEEVWMKYFES